LRDPAAALTIGLLKNDGRIIMKVSAVGIPWYEHKDYPRILEIMADANHLPASHADFIKLAEQAERQFKARGFVVHRAVIKPDEFVAWCKTRGLNVDSKARTRFANEAAFASLKRGD
jgi:hypothetical protein